MADQDDVRRIAAALPGVIESHERFAFAVENKRKAKGFLWLWQERIHPKKPRVPNPEVLAARVADLTERATLLAGDPEVFFTEPHYADFPAVLVRLPVVTAAVLRKVVLEAWRCQAPKELVAAFEAGDPAVATPRPAAPRAAARRTSAAKPRAAARRTSAAKPARPAKAKAGAASPRARRGRAPSSRTR
jgi:hypothetical protein